MSDGTNWIAMQEAMGCPDCRFADRKALGYGPCCQYIGRLEVDEEGACQCFKRFNDPEVDTCN